MPEETVAKGDLIRLDYDIWAETGDKSEIIDTTNAAVAKEAHWQGRKDDEFGPVPYELGKNRFPAALEKALEGAKVGAVIEKELAPGEAFGERDPKLIETVSLREIARLPEMRKEGAQLEVGMTLTVNGRKGRVTSFTAGRVRLDFNDPLAGRRLKAKVTVKEKITVPEERVKAVVEMEYGRSNEFTLEIKDNVITMIVPDRAKFDMVWHVSKGRVVESLRKYLKPEMVIIAEEYKTTVEAPKEPAKPAKAAKAPAEGAKAPAEKEPAP
jgi:FKBP-type peptidyl-prolyl cis-trans isomerase SlyD